MGGYPRVTLFGDTVGIGDMSVTDLAICIMKILLSPISSRSQIIVNNISVGQFAVLSLVLNQRPYDK